MSHPDPLGRAWPSVVPIADGGGAIIGTGVVIGRGLVLTALHVVDRELAPRVRGFGVAQVVALPLRRFGAVRSLAFASYQRSRDIIGDDLGTVDLALLAVPDLAAPAVALRDTPAERGERVAVAGYPSGRWTVSFGPITSRDDADMVAHLTLGPGASGSPAVDGRGRLVGLVTMDHAKAGTILIGPVLISRFVAAAVRPVRHLVPRGGASGEEQA